MILQAWGRSETFKITAWELKFKLEDIFFDGRIIMKF
jgi:hypothetical protein